MNNKSKTIFFIDNFSSAQKSSTGSSQLFHYIICNLADTHQRGNLAITANKLVSLAEHTHAQRQMDLLEQISEALLTLPFPTEIKTIGLYYKALCTQKLGKGNLSQAEAMHQEVTEKAPHKFKARAIVSLAAIYRRRGETTAAARLYREASQLSLTNQIDAQTIIGSNKMTAVLMALHGDHKNALAALENLYQTATSMRAASPYTFYDYLNSLATELLEVGRIEEAHEIAIKVIASPFAHSHPEWQDTYFNCTKALEQKRARASRITPPLTTNTPITASPIIYLHDLTTSNRTTTIEPRQNSDPESYCRAITTFCENGKLLMEPDSIYEDWITKDRLQELTEAIEFIQSPPPCQNQKRRIRLVPTFITKHHKQYQIWERIILTDFANGKPKGSTILFDQAITENQLLDLIRLVEKWIKEDSLQKRAQKA